MLYSSTGDIIRTQEPLPSKWYQDYSYFELKIVSQGEAGSLYIGLSLDISNISLPETSGTGGSYWYSNDGTICHNGWVPFGPRFGLNDVIGCGIEKRALLASGEPEYRLFFTFNGQNLGSSVDIEKSDLKEKGLYPSLYFTGIGWEVNANFGIHPF